MTAEQNKRLLKAKIAVALQNELGRVPKQEEIEQVFLMAKVRAMARPIVDVDTATPVSTSKSSPCSSRL